MSDDLKAYTEDAWAEWLSAAGGGVDVSYNGGTAVKGIVVAGSTVSLGRETAAPKEGSVRLLASQIGTVAEDGVLTVAGTRVFIAGVRVDACGAVTTIDFSESRPVTPDML